MVYCWSLWSGRGLIRTLACWHEILTFAFWHQVSCSRRDRSSKLARDVTFPAQDRCQCCHHPCFQCRTHSSHNFLNSTQQRRKSTTQPQTISNEPKHKDICCSPLLLLSPRIDALLPSCLGGGSLWRLEATICHKESAHLQHLGRFQ